jgi:tRNA(fMet)-specific endonuclease VapC
LNRVYALLAEVPVLTLKPPADPAYGTIRAELEAAGETIGHNDLLIAAHAQVLEATMVLRANGIKNIAQALFRNALNLENLLDDDLS